MSIKKFFTIFVILILIFQKLNSENGGMLDSAANYANATDKQKQDLKTISKEQYQTAMQAASDRFDGKTLGIASGKQCDRDMLFATVVSGYVALGSCVASIMFGLIPVLGQILIATCVGSLIYFIAQSVQHLTCILTTVRDPVRVFDEKFITNPNDYRYKYIERDSSGKVTSRQYAKSYMDDKGDLQMIGTKNYDEATRAIGSDFMTVCYRSFAGNIGNSLIMSSKSDYEKMVYYDEKLLPEESRYAKTEKMNLSSRFRLQDFLATGGDPQCSTPMRVGETQIIGGNARVKIINAGSKICAQLTGNGISEWLSKPLLGCQKKSNQGVAPMCNKSIPLSDESGRASFATVGDKKPLNSFKATAFNQNPSSYDNRYCFSCEIAQSCSVGNLLHSKSPVPISSMIVQCFFDSVDLALGGRSLSDPMLNCPKHSLLYTFQKNLSRTIQTLLMLMVMFFAFKTMLAGEVKNKDFMLFVIKFALVFYFVDPDGGMRKYYMELRKLNSAIVNMVFEASSANGLCNFPNDSYKLSSLEYDFDNKETVRVKRDYSFLKIWDMIDCRVFAYMLTGIYGGDLPSESELRDNAENNFKNPKLIPLVGAFNAGDQMIVGLMVFFIFIIVVSILIWLTIMYIFCFTALAILIYCSPLFIPMILLEVTKPFFDGWLNSVIGFSAFPVAVVGFCSFFFVMVDDFYFGEAIFHNKSYIDSYGVEKMVFNIEPNPYDKNKLFFVLKNIKYDKKFSKIGGYYSTVDDSSMEISSNNLYEELLLLLMMLLFFIMFLSIANNIAAEISGGGRAMIDFGHKSANPVSFIKKGVGAVPRAFGAAKDGAKKLKAKYDKHNKSEKNSTERQGVDGKSGASGAGGGAGGGGAGAAAGKGNKAAIALGVAKTAAGEIKGPITEGARKQTGNDKNDSKKNDQNSKDSDNNDDGTTNR